VAATSRAVANPLEAETPPPLPPALLLAIVEFSTWSPGADAGNVPDTVATSPPPSPSARFAEIVEFVTSVKLVSRPPPDAPVSLPVMVDRSIATSSPSWFPGVLKIAPPGPEARLSAT
jgi:hypothetical protein